MQRASPLLHSRGLMPERNVTSRENSLDAQSMLFRDAPTAIFLLDRDGLCTAVNRRFTALTGLSDADAKGHGWVRAIPPAEQPRIDAAVRALVLEGQPCEWDVEIDSTEGPCWVHCAMNPLVDDDGKHWAYVGWLADIRWRKEAEAERVRLNEDLVASSELHRLAQRVGRFGHWTLERGALRAIWSEEMFALWGRKLEDGVPTLAEIYSRLEPAERVRLERATDQLRPGEIDDIEYRALGWDGVWRWFHSRRTQVRGPDGKPARLVGLQQDVSWRHEERNEGEQRDRLLRGLTLALPDPAVAHDGETVLFANRAAAALLGWDHPDQLAGVPFASLMPDASRERNQARTARALAGGNNPGVELGLLRRDGTTCPVEMSSLAAEYAGKPAVLEMARDLSARRAAEEQRLVSDRASALATLASGVAHEVNNPLAALLSNVELLADGLTDLSANAASPAPQAAELSEIARDVRSSALRVKAIVRDLQTFASGGAQEMVPQDPTDALDLALRLVQQELRGRCTVVKRYQRAPLVNVDRGQLAQAFTNLLTNAVQAMAGSHSAACELRLSVGRSEDGGAAIEISDTGPGISPENLPRIFEPFFTTRGPGHGSGLGLSVALNAVKAMGGTITARSEPGHGATFRVLLPAASVSSAVAASEKLNDKMGRLLVVDDDPLIGQSLRRLLGRESNVVIATSAAGALAELEKNGAFDLLLVDMVMPGTDGIALFETLEKRAPELASRVIFMTGGAVSRRERNFLDEGTRVLVEKPFHAARVRALVHDAVAARRS